MSEQSKIETERRALERYDLQLPVNIKWKDHTGKIMEENTTSKNISSGGVYIILSNSIKKGTRIDLWFDLSIPVEGVKKTRVFAKGEVVRSVKEGKAFGHGIKFMNYKFLRVDS